MFAKIYTTAAELRLRDLLLMALTVSSGAIDAISFIALGKVFTAFMTGNIAFFGLRVAGADGPGYVAILVSMIAFSAGIFVSTKIVGPLKPSGAWPYQVTLALGLSLPAHVGFVAVWLVSHAQPSVEISHVLIGLWAFPMGMQSAAVRRLQVDGVFTTAATATVILLVGGLSSGSATPAESRRFVGVLFCLFAGAITGSLLLVNAPVLAPFLPFVITTIVVATAGMALRDGKPAGHDERGAPYRIRGVGGPT